MNAQTYSSSMPYQGMQSLAAGRPTELCNDVKTGAIEHQLQQLDKAAATFSELWSLHQQKISSVFIPYPATPVKNEPNASMMPVLAERLRQICERVRQVSDDINQTTKQVEL
jgi:hypothetical protein